MLREGIVVELASALPGIVSTIPTHFTCHFYTSDKLYLKNTRRSTKEVQLITQLLIYKGHFPLNISSNGEGTGLGGIVEKVPSGFFFFSLGIHLSVCSIA